MLVKVNVAPLKVLDWAVARAEGFDAQLYEKKRIALIDKNKNTLLREYSPSTDWAQGGPIIEREIDTLRKRSKAEESCLANPNPNFRFKAEISGDIAGYFCGFGPTPLIAAMRCYVVSRFGEEIEVPDYLLKTDQLNVKG